MSYPSPKIGGSGAQERPSPPTPQPINERPLATPTIAAGYLSRDARDGERYDHYRGVVIQISGKWRIASCREGRQWILQRRKGRDQWIGLKFFSNKQRLAKALPAAVGIELFGEVRDRVEALPV